MRVILHKDSFSSNFERYVDLNFIQGDYNTLCIHWGDDKNYNEWFAKFLKEDVASQMQIIHYYFLKYKDSKDALEAENGKIISHIFSQNKSILNDFISSWFFEELTDFGELNLDLENLENEISHRIESVDGSLIALEFKDGSAIQFLDGDDTLGGVYIEEYRYESLVYQLKKIVEIFRI